MLAKFCEISKVIVDTIIHNVKINFICITQEPLTALIFAVSHFLDCAHAAYINFEILILLFHLSEAVKMS